MSGLLQRARALVPVLLYPACLAAAASIMAWAPGAAALRVALAALVVVALVTIAEAKRPFRAKWQTSHGDGLSDALHAAVGLAITQALVVFGAQLAETYLADARLFWPRELPFFMQLVLLLVVTDLLGYALHRAMHSNPLLWRAHAVHHGAERLYWLNAFRLHPFDVGLNGFVCILWAVIFQVHPEVFAMHAALVTAHLLVQHSNVDLRLARLSPLLAGPAFHRVHHHPEIESRHYGHVFGVWDWLFASYDAAAIDAPVCVGSRQPMPRTYLGQLSLPFRRPTNPDLHLAKDEHHAA